MSPDQRHWLKHPAPYAAAIVALAMITPVIVWNAQHGWVSFEFQGGRGVSSGRAASGAAHDHGPRPDRFSVAVDICRRWLPAWRTRFVNGRTSAAFPALPEPAADRSLHLDPTMGRARTTALDDARLVLRLRPDGDVWSSSSASARALRRWAVVSSVLLAAIAGAAILQASTGWPWLALTAGTGLADPMLEAFEWRELRTAPIFDQAPSFVIAMKWSNAGKIALALGLRPLFSCSQTILEAGRSWTIARVSLGGTGSSSRR